VSTNSDKSGATIRSPQWGQRAGDARQRARPDNFAGSVGSRIIEASSIFSVTPFAITTQRGEGETLS
jgi:hypothetical protein